MAASALPKSQPETADDIEPIEDWIIATLRSTAALALLPFAPLLLLLLPRLGGSGDDEPSTAPAPGGGCLGDALPGEDRDVLDFDDEPLPAVARAAAISAPAVEEVREGLLARRSSGLSSEAAASRASRAAACSRAIARGTAMGAEGKSKNTEGSNCTAQQ